MSGFYFHIRCPTCQLESQGMELADHVLPFADQSSRRLGVQRIDGLSGSRSEVAMRLSRDGLEFTNPGLADGGIIVLRPPLLCPRCGSLIENGTWGSPPAVKHAIERIEEAVRLSREPNVGGRKFRLGELRIDCWPAMEGDRLGQEWRLSDKSTNADLFGIADRLIALLEQQGSTCESPWGRRWVQFTEWWGSEGLVGVAHPEHEVGFGGAR